MKGDQLKFFTANVAQKESLKNLSFYLSSTLWGHWPVEKGDEKSKVELTCVATSPELTGAWET